MAKLPPTMEEEAGPRLASVLRVETDLYRVEREIQTKNISGVYKVTKKFHTYVILDRKSNDLRPGRSAKKIPHYLAI
jgi:hypothetical protein